ncbi:MAG: flagellar assembly peptidoglycan hydrolase FlgJ [Azoarcus sp.]|jgi:flagellar protein FlgJ|nr:flagellar assembly peptidoglycan hydrolase FlgJ [Azoarcus sp.]
MPTNDIQINTLDPRSLGELKRLARSDGRSDEALRAAAKQGESLFLQMVLKSMRDATPHDGLLESDQTRLVQDLYDKQLASNLAHGKGVGLAKALFHQLGGIEFDPSAAGCSTGQGTSAAGSSLKAGAVLNFAGSQAKPGALSEIQSGRAAMDRGSIMLAHLNPHPAKETSKDMLPESARQPSSLAATADAIRKAPGNPPQQARDFVASVWPSAHAASIATGIPAHFMVAQAALETGWGAKMPKNADGTPSYNLFNIKAGRGWDGPTTAQHTVSEYNGEGSWKHHKAAFRSYASFDEAFADYARFLIGNPRYANVLSPDTAMTFAKGLQNAGYATDPMYADKLVRIIGGKTLKNVLAATENG